MKAIILAAGIASRLRPLTDTQPKCLLKIGKRCLLERTMDALISNNIKEFIIVTGYRQQQIIDFLQKRYPLQNITFIYNERYAINQQHLLFMAYCPADNKRRHPALGQ